MLRALKLIFSRPTYAILAAFISFGLFLFVAWLPNRDLLVLSLSSDIVSFWRLLLQSHRFFATNVTFVSAAITVIVIMLSGINISMLAYYLRRRIETERKSGLGVSGTLVGLVGVGCAACGSVILSSIFGLSAAAGFLGFFPFRGIELGAIGAVMLVVSIVLLGKKIINPAQCKITV
jgi:hypothetical protein